MSRQSHKLESRIVTGDRNQPFYPIRGCGRSDMRSAVYGNEEGSTPFIPAIDLFV